MAKSVFLAEAESNMAEVKDAAAVKAASPDYDSLKSEFGAVSMEGSRDNWKLNIKRPDLSDTENQQRWDRFRAMYRGKVDAARERSLRRDAQGSKVLVRDRNGTLMSIPAKQEANAARKGVVSAVRAWGRRRKRYRASDLPEVLESKPLRTAAEIRGW